MASGRRVSTLKHSDYVCAFNFLALVRVRFDGLYLGPLPYGVLQAEESRRPDDWIFARYQARDRECR